ncbi:MAG TPA: quinolinate synthase NadA [Chlamydiales bacterium]|jgi:quinolinate synthase|nr:quinolinate synthase NadA [Chlamydiales bacterium]
MTLQTPLSPESLYERLSKISVSHPLCRYTLERCRSLTPAINRILGLKKEKNAVILAHTYVHPDIVYGVADHVGDSYGLSKAACTTDAQVIVFPSVRFMAETAKILNPEKIVIDPNPKGGCSLADSIDEATVLRLREKHPHHTFVCYVNTTAAVKAACDVCVTSSNVYRILEKIPSDKIYFLPDKYMGENGKNWLKKRGIDKEVLLYPGACYIHEEFEPATIDLIRSEHENAIVIAHPECKPEVIAKADLTGSTTDMQRYVADRSSLKRPFLLLTECGVASRINAELPEAHIVGGCSLCKYMRSNSLSSIEEALANPTPSQVIEIEPRIRERAVKTLERMFEYAE